MRGTTLFNRVADPFEDGALGALVLRDLSVLAAGLNLCPDDRVRGPLEASVPLIYLLLALERKIRSPFKDSGATWKYSSPIGR